MLRVVGAVVAAYMGYKYGDDLVRLLQQRHQKRIVGNPRRRKPRAIIVNDADAEDEEDDDVFRWDGGYTGDSDGSTSLTKSKCSFDRGDHRKSHDQEANDIPLCERQNSQGNHNVDQFGYRRNRCGTVNHKTYSLDIPVHPSSRKHSLQDNEGESIVKEAVHIPARYAQDLQDVEPTKKWRRLSIEEDEKVPPEVIRDLRARFSFESGDEELLEHFGDLSCSGGLPAARGTKQSRNKAEIRGKEDEHAYKVCESNDSVSESEGELLKSPIGEERVEDKKLDSAAGDHGVVVQTLKECELEEVNCMSEEIYSKLHKEIVGVKSINEATDKVSNGKTEHTSRSHSRTYYADHDASGIEFSFQRWVSIRTGSNGRIVFWHSKGKLYDYLTGEPLVNVEAVDVTRGVFFSPDTMHQLSERIFLFRDRDSNEVLTEYKGVPLTPIHHSFSHTWNASQAFTKVTKGPGNKYESLKVNVSATRQPNEKSKLTFNCRISLTVGIDEGKFQWHEIGDYDFREDSSDPDDVYHCSLLYMGAIPPIFHLAVMHLSGWRVDDVNRPPASCKDYVQLGNISWIEQPEQ
ncbi:hypothetical protein R1sor_004290 [Riccia sorocarpa]|uniref:Uncharacterized protein n=1 Tax=Riccia sorocarpa TaxID=122646 RepID=A0ABD3HKB8_9MARC